MIKTSVCIIATVIVCATLMQLQSCKQDFTTTPDNIVKFPPEVEAVFNTPYTSNNVTCTTPSCHANENSASGLNLVDWQKAMNGSGNGTMIIPYNGFWSHMIAVLNNDTNYAPVINITVPEPSVHKIDTSRVHTIMNWINGGAKDVNGNVAFSNIDPNDKGFITNQAADVVAVIQPNERRTVRLIPVGGRPNSLDAAHYVILSPDKNYFYVSLIQEGYVEKYNATTYALVGRMQAPSNPAHIEISGDGHNGFVTNFFSGTSETITRRFDAHNMTVNGTFSDVAMTGPHGMALSPDDKWLYVTSEIGEYIFKISAENFYASDSTYIKGPIDPTVPPGGQGTTHFRPYQIVLSPDGSLMYVSCRGSNEVRIYRTNDLVQVNAIALGTNAFPLLMKLTSDGKYLFVCNRNNNTVSVINCQTQTVQTTIPNVGVQPHGVDFTADGQYAIIACETQSGFDGHHPQVGSNKIGVSRIIQVSNFSLLPNKLEMGSFPAGIAIVK